MTTPTVTATATSVAPAKSAKSAQRLQLESLLRDFQAKLGNDWETYHEALSAFLVGRLSRPELVAAVGPLMKNGLVQYHNKLLLYNFAATLPEQSPSQSSHTQDHAGELVGFWNKRNARSRGVRSNQYEKFKQNIMGLPLKERRRIRAITRDSGKRDRLSASITLTRQALLPKIPMLQDKEQQQMQVNNLVQWQQDVVTGIHTPLATTSYELPDADTLSRRVVMTSREHGLTGGINARVFDVISLGLEAHLKNVLECAVDTVRYRRRKYESVFLAPAHAEAQSGAQNSVARLRVSESAASDAPGISDARKDVTISTEDMYNTLEMFPYLVEPGGPQVRLASLMLQNDDSMDGENSTIAYELPPRPKVDTGFGSSSTGTDSTPAKAADGEETSKPESSAKSSDGKNREGVSESTGTKRPETHEENGHGQGHVSNGVKPVAPAREPSHIGSADELKWMLHDLITSS